MSLGYPLTGFLDDRAVLVGSRGSATKLPEQQIRYQLSPGTALASSRSSMLRAHVLLAAECGETDEVVASALSVGPSTVLRTNRGKAGQ